MADRLENYRVGNRATTTELFLDEKPAPVERKDHRLDGEPMRRELRRLVEWYFQERERQAVNRYQMAIDQDFYDNLQWGTEDAQEVTSRGQAPIVYNEVAPMADWLTGTERRTRVDWNVLPRAEDDVDAADTKKKVLKYLSDVNHVPFKRSRAFADAVKVGVGWLDDGVNNDPTKEVIYSGYEDWRCVLWDSAGSSDLSVEDGRYLFRWKWVDLDIAQAIFPDRRDALARSAVAASLVDEEDEDFWYLGQHFQARDEAGNVVGRRTYLSDSGLVGNRRSRVKLIEGWYKMPTRCKMCYGDHDLDGQEYDAKNPDMVKAHAEGQIGLFDQIRMHMYVAIFTESDLIAHGRTPYKHERYPLTPVWCYRRGRDRMPYGVIRRVRDVQEDLNKRMSKSQFVMSTNQVIAEEGAAADWDEIREEADRPDGVIVHAKNHKLEIRRDEGMAKGHLELAQFDAQKIQRTAGVNDENLGRETNAESGEAIKARQIQGSVTTTEPFDNLRYAVQLQGEKQLSLAEQFMSAPKVIRLTGHRGKLDWVKINTPEIQPDGSVRWLNDITASAADFVVSEQDFHGSLRQAMFETMMQLVARAGITPDLALKLLRMSFEFSDFPNKDEIVADLRRMTGEVDPNEKMTPEEAQQQAQLQAQQQALVGQQRKAGELAMAEQQANINMLNAKAAEIMRNAEQVQGGGENDVARQIEDAVRQVQMQADQRSSVMSEKMVKLQAEVTNRAAEIGKDADTKLEVARIENDAKVRVAEIENESTKAFDQIMARMDELAEQMKEVARESNEDRGEAKETAAQAAPVAPSIVFEPGAIQIGTGLPSAAKPAEEVEQLETESEPTVKTMTIKGPDGKVYTGEVRDNGEGGKAIKITRPDGQVYSGSIEEH